MRRQSLRSTIGKATAIVLFSLFFFNATFITAQEEPSVNLREMQIYITVEIADTGLGQTMPRTSEAGELLTTVPGVPLKIKGIAMAVAGKQLQITITPPQRPQMPNPAEAPGELPNGDRSQGVCASAARRLPPTVLQVSVSSAGLFEADFTPQTTGEHEVTAIDATGSVRGETRFEVEDPCELNESLRDEIEKEVEKILENLREIMKPLQERIDELPESPAKDEAKQKAKELQQEFESAYPKNSLPSWINALDHLADLQRVAPSTNKATAPLKSGMRNWLKFARDSNKQAPTVRAELTSGNVLCDNLDTIINGLKFFDFMLSLLTKPIDFFVDWAKENIPPKLLAMIPAVRQTPAVKEGVESAWKGIVTFKPKRMNGKLRVGVEGYERAMGIKKTAIDLSTYFASRIFEVYCQTFQGPISGKMFAEFHRADGATWWTYTIEIQGELVLRYPKEAKGEKIALTGEFIGNAVKFRSWDNAVPVLFPKLSQGTILKTIRTEPFGMGETPFLGESETLKNKKIFGQDLPSFNPLPSVIDKGGQVTRFLLTPAFFKVPVRGELSGTKLTIELKNAVVDFEDASVKVYQIMLPVLAMRIFINEYALPYKGARFIIFRAMNDAPAEFQVQRVGKTMFIERIFNRKKRTAGSTGIYNLSVKACNPGCSGGQINDKDNKKSM